MRRLLLITSCLMLTACSTAQAPEQAAQKVPDAQRWWRCFSDPLMDSLADQLLDQNIDIKIAQARVDEARGVVRTTQSGWFPDISANGNALRGNDNLGTTGPVSIAKGGFDASWELDVFGRTRSQVSAAESRLDASIATVDDVRNSVLADLMKAIIQWRQSQQTVKETKDLLSAQEDQVKLLRSRAKAGLIDASFLERAQAEYAQTATQLPLAQAQADAAEYQIERLMGKSSGELQNVLGEQQSKELQVPPVDTALQIPIETIRVRPDVRAVEDQMFAAQGDLANAEANLWPRISISGFYGAQATSGQVLAADNPLWSLASGVSMPLLNFGRLRGAVDTNNAKAKEAALSYENVTLTALQETKTALSDYINGSNAVTQQDAALKHRRDAVKLAKERFTRGLTDMTDLTTAQAELDHATITLIDRKADAAIAYIRLQKALGVSVSKN